MGLFDGVPGAPGRTGASADIAAALGLALVLLVMLQTASGQAQSAAAVVQGCATYGDPRIRIAGVVLNKIGSPRHARLAGDAITALGIPVVGILPRSSDIVLPERHLGLVQAGETDDLERRLDAMADFVAANVQIDTIRSLADARNGA